MYRKNFGNLHISSLKAPQLFRLLDLDGLLGLHMGTQRVPFTGYSYRGMYSDIGSGIKVSKNWKPV